MTTGVKTLVDETGQRLLAYIAERGLIAGDPMPSEAELVDVLGVGRGVMREALSRLRMLGMIDARPRRGMILTEPKLFAGLSYVLDAPKLPTNTEQDLTELRVMLEIGQAAFVFERKTPEAIANLTAIVERMETATSWPQLLDLDAEFHTSLLLITGNHALVSLADVTASFFRRRWDLAQKDLGLDSHVWQVQSHRMLLDVLQGDSREAFAAAMYEHVVCHVEFTDAQHREMADD